MRATDLFERVIVSLYSAVPVCEDVCGRRDELYSYILF